MIPAALKSRARRGVLLTLDPATRRCGVARFRKAKLERAWTERGRNPEAVTLNLTDQIASASVIVIEVPVTRKRTQGFDPDLEGLRIMVARVRKLARRFGVPVVGRKPERWKASVPKSVCAHRALSILTEAESTAIVDDSDDTTDAIGIGLVALGRAKRGLV